MFIKRKKIILTAILFLAAILRFYRLGEYPALNADEAALGYNAYSLLETGMDEHGNPWPIHFQSFNDYKPGLYVYLVMPFVAVFGLDVFWVRFPGASAGVLTVFVLYLLVSEILRSHKVSPQSDENKSLSTTHLTLSLISAVFLAINPWHIHFSRGAWEVNVATFFLTAGVYLFLKALNRKQFKSFVFWVMSFALSLYTYHSARIIAPLLGIGLLLVYLKQVKSNLKPLVISMLIGFFVVTPLLFDLYGGAVLSRVAGVGLFADTGPLNRINEQRGQHTDVSSLSSVLLHNKAVNYSLAFLENWGEHYHGLFLFVSGEEIQRNAVPETGQMYLFDILLIPLGIAYIIKRKLRGGVFTLWWLLIAPTAAALTFQSPHALRAQNMVIPLAMLSAFGFYFIFENIKKIPRFEAIPTPGVGMSLLMLLVIWNFARYQHMYWVHMAKEYPFSSQYGVEQLVDYVKENKMEGQQVVVTDRYDQPYILFLFYLDYPPDKFQQEHNITSRDEFGFSTVSQFGDYHFRSIQFEEVRVQYRDSLIAGTDEEIPDEANIVKESYGINGYKYFEVVRN